MKFDWTINAGTVFHLLTVSALIVGFGVKFAMAQKIHCLAIQEIKEDIREIKKELIASLDRRLHEVEMRMAGFTH